MNVLLAVVLFALALASLSLGVLLLVMTWGSGLGVAWGIVSLLVGIGLTVGGVFAAKSSASSS
jgi:hypothetical protein